MSDEWGNLPHPYFSTDRVIHSHISDENFFKVISLDTFSCLNAQIGKQRDRITDFSKFQNHF